MKSHARVVVIGGGIGGCSTLYHLTQEGWTDVVLVERDELTAGSTWHAAAQVTNFGALQTMVGLKSHSIRLYKELAEDPEFPFAYYITGGTRLAHTDAHIDAYKHFVSMAKGMGVDFEVLDAEETGRRHPLLTKDGLKGCLWDPLDGDVDPSGVTQALARRARQAGAEVYRFNPVENITLKPNGEWIVHTKNGDVTCEIVVSAAGYRLNEVGRMLGVVHPVVSMEHMYFLTEPLAQLEAQDWRVPIIRCPQDDFYSRQEKKGLLVGIYEQGCKTWGMDGIDPNFTMQLCPNDLDRCLDNMERVFERLPCLTETGIHTVINGPITYTPDGLPLIGPIPGLRNAYACLGLRAGIGEGGGHGKMLAQIIVHGQAEFDTWCLDPRRLTSHCTT
ncbi:MAG: FAD-binding oxidoreductase, partial [Serratia inhibens]|uniref:NAD(P)/FAD-dependent oxidoreductase n=1 Tax=Serratia inhibens TaxID=2338073 RepID=UPI003C7A13AC